MFNSIKLTKILLSVSVLGILAGYAIRNPDKVGLCDVTDRVCVFSFPIFTVGEPLYWSSIALASVFFLLLFVKAEIFKTWAKFAVPYIVLAFIILVSGITEEGLFSPGRELASQFLGALYVGLSLMVIFGKYMLLKFRAPKV